MVVRCIMIIAKSGIVLCSRQFPLTSGRGGGERGWLPSGQGGLVFGSDGGGSAGINGRMRMLIGNVITTMIQFSELTVGMRMCYMELQEVAVSVVGGHSNRPYCVVFHDLEDGAGLGKVIASQILNAFWESFGSHMGGANNAIIGYNNFLFSIGDVLCRAVQPVLDRLASLRGIDLAIFVTEDNKVYQSGEVEKLGVLANLHALVARSTDLMQRCGDSGRVLSLDEGGDGRNCIMLWVLVGGIFIISITKSKPMTKFLPIFKEYTRLLSKLCHVTAEFDER